MSLFAGGLYAWGSCAEKSNNNAYFLQLIGKLSLLSLLPRISEWKFVFIHSLWVWSQCCFDLIAGWEIPKNPRLCGRSKWTRWRLDIAGLFLSLWTKINLRKYQTEMHNWGLIILIISLFVIAYMWAPWCEQISSNI